MEIYNTNMDQVTQLHSRQARGQSGADWQMEAVLSFGKKKTKKSTCIRHSSDSPAYAYCALHAFHKSANLTFVVFGAAMPSCASMKR